MSLKDKVHKWLDNFQEKHNFNLAWFIRYAAGGTITAAVEFGLFFLLSVWEKPWMAIVSLLPADIQAAAAGELQLWAIVVSNIASYVVNYFLSKYWVFRSPETKHSRDAVLFAISSITNLIVVFVSAKFILVGLELIPITGKLWDKLVPLIGKIGSNVVAFITVLIFKRFIIWNDTSKY